MLKIAVYGSASLNHTKDLKEKAFSLGMEIANSGNILVTGACPGLPYEAVRGAEGGEIIGYSPFETEKEHRENKYPVVGFSGIIYTGAGKLGRNMLSVEAIDIAVFINGGIGTLNEFTIAYFKEKVIAALDESGGVCDFIPDFFNSIERKTKAKLIVDSNPKNLVLKSIEILH